ncbi:hypothetical protein JCM10295v2_005876 [Rhodotorula toruloides]
MRFKLPDELAGKYYHLDEQGVVTKMAVEPPAKVRRLSIREDKSGGGGEVVSPSSTPRRRGKAKMRNTTSEVIAGYLSSHYGAAFSPTPTTSTASTPPATPPTSVEATPEPSDFFDAPDPTYPPDFPVPPKLDDPDARAIADTKSVALQRMHLESLRSAFEDAAKTGDAAFVALDVEFWERDFEVLLEFGWSVVDFQKDEETGEIHPHKENQHIVVRDNMHRKNSKYVADSRHLFQFGRSLVYDQHKIATLLQGMLANYATSKTLYLIFHDPNMDLKALHQLGFDVKNDFAYDLRKLGSQSEEGKCWVVDSQSLFSGWMARKCQVGLLQACEQVDVKPKALHNAGNDAHYTLELFEKLMDRSHMPSPTSELVTTLDFRASHRLQARKKKKETKMPKAQSVRPLEIAEMRQLRMSVETPV